VDAIVGLFSNPLILLAGGYAVSHAPGIRAVIPNKIIPLLQALVAFLSAIVAPQAAHAMGGPLALPVAVAMPAFGLAWLGSLGTAIGSALWQSTQSYLLHRMFGNKFVPEPPGDSK
jgi:hypothetical protein